MVMSAAGRIGLLFGLAILASANVSAKAEERIFSFDSRIAVSTDMSLDVTETITINVEGTTIKRGIVKDLPASPKGGSVRSAGLGVKVLSVTRDGVNEPFHLEPGQSGTQLRIGKADVLLAAKPTTYVIHYRVTRPVGSLNKFNELQWDVTGNSWALPIDAAFVTVELPKGSQVAQGSAAVRQSDGKGRDLQIGTSDGAKFSARTTAPLPPGAHFTVLVEWPKGLVAEGGSGFAQFPAVQWGGKRKRFGELRLR
jgi:hypothetical protein